MGLEYSVTYHPLVPKDDLPKLSSSMKLRVRTAIEQKLMTQPNVFGIPLRQSLKGHRKLRVGSYRIVFQIKKKTVFVVAILHRARVYQEIVGRMD